MKPAGSSLLIRKHPSDLIKRSGYVHCRQWCGRPRHEVRVPSHRRREHHNGNNNDYELTHALEIAWNSWPECEELHRMVWPLLISKFRLSYVHWYTDPETRAANRVFGRMRSMADYRAYTVGLDGRLIGFEPLVCADDAEAIGLSSLSVTGRSSFGTGHASLKLGSNKICRPPPSPLG